MLHVILEHPSSLCGSPPSACATASSRSVQRCVYSGHLVERTTRVAEQLRFGGVACTPDIMVVMSPVSPVIVSCFAVVAWGQATRLPHDVYQDAISAFDKGDYPAGRWPAVPRDSAVALTR